MHDAVAVGELHDVALRNRHRGRNVAALRDRDGNRLRTGARDDCECQHGDDSDKSLVEHFLSLVWTLIQVATCVHPSRWA